MKRATSTPAGLNVKKITAYLKGQAKSRNAVRITCQGGSVYIFTGYAAFKLPAVLYPEVIQPVTMQAAPADGVTIVSSDDGFVVNDPHQLTAAQMFQKFSNCKEEVKRTSLLQEVEMKGKIWGTFRMFRDGSRPIMINSEYDAFVDHHEFVYHGSNNPLAPILATDTSDPKRAAVAVLIAPMRRTTKYSRYATACLHDLHRMPWQGRTGQSGPAPPPSIPPGISRNTKRGLHDDHPKRFPGLLPHAGQSGL